MLDYLYYLQIDLAAMKVANARSHDQTLPLGPQMTDDDYRQAIRDYFADVETIDDETVETALQDIKRHWDDQEIVSKMCETVLGILPIENRLK